VRRIALTAAVGGVALLAFGGVASAHPLGNFSVNHAHSIHVTADHFVDEAVIDTAEIPAAQAETDVDTDGDGIESTAELAAYGAQRCAAFASDVRLTVDGVATNLAVTRSSFERVPGAAALTTTRLECRLESPIEVGTGADIGLDDAFEPGRIGWHEIIATADGAHLVGSPVPTTSSTDHLRTYPVDLLSSPLDVRQVTLRVEPGGATVAVGDAPAAASGDAVRDGAADGPLRDLTGPVNRAFDRLVGTHDLTLGVGLLAVALSLVLGASHALLPGHGKTVMAAYIAGRQGTSRDAVVVGATVTATHTGGVLVLGLALTLSSSLAGESVLAWLGIVSGLLIAGLGASLLIGSIRGRTTSFAHGHHHGAHGHHHGHVHHGHGHHGHGHHRGHHHRDDDRSHEGVPGHGRAPSRRVHVRSHTAAEQPPDGGSVAVLARSRTIVVRRSTPVSATVAVSAPTAGPTRAAAPVSRRSLIGMGIAGGLVPSPSALVVLLSAIALGRTAFGVLLVVGYGLGMAATLTAAGLLLVRVRDRFQRITDGRVGRAAARWQRVSPYLTAALVLAVGIGLVGRSLGQL
jgi:nickel/cobalt transporter (NicO) family protein